MGIRDKLSEERGGLEMEVNREYEKVVVLSDIHAPYHDKKTYTTMMRFVKDQKPDMVVLIGDLVDMYSVSKFDKDPTRANRLQEEFDVSYNLLRRLRDAAGTGARIVYIAGNHESVSRDTEFLTELGWIRADEIKGFDGLKLAQFNVESGEITFAQPSEFIEHEEEYLYEFESNNMKQRVTKKHDVLVDGVKMHARDLFNSKKQLNESQFRLAGQCFNSYVPEGVDKQLIKLAVWTAMDGTIVDYRTGDYEGVKSNKCRLQFKLSKPEKIAALRAFLDEEEIEYTFSAATMSAFNKLQPYYIRIYGEVARNVSDLLFYKQFPDLFVELPKDYVEEIIDVISQTDGYKRSKHVVAWTSTSKRNVDVVQEMCLRNGLYCSYKENDCSKSGFKNGKTQYNVKIGLSEQSGIPTNNVSITKVKYNDTAYCVTMPEGTIITRLDGKVAFTGNSRLNSYLKRHPELHGLRDLTIEKQLRLETLDVEYRKELFHRGTFLFTHGRRYGMYASRWELSDNGVSGMSGHNHRVSMFAKKDRQGVKAWYHIGHMCDEKTAAEYRPNPDWQQGFGMVYFHKRSNRFFAQAVPIVDNNILFGGKLYSPKGVKLLK